MNNRPNKSVNRQPVGHNNDWHMNLKTYSQDVSQVTSQVSTLLVNLKKAKEMLETGETRVSAERPYGFLGVERLRNTGKVMLRVMDGADRQIGPTVQICAPTSTEKFMVDDRTGLVVPMKQGELVPWKESLKLAIRVIGDMLRYVEIGKFIERARLSWDNLAELEPLANAIQERLSMLNLEGDDEGAGILRGYLTRLVWPVCNGRTYASLEQGFDDNPTIGCWIYSQTAVICERTAELQKQQLADLDQQAFVQDMEAVLTAVAEAEPQTVAPIVLTKIERQALLAKAQKAVSLKAGNGPVPQPEFDLTAPKPTVEAVVPQDA